jgi:hypothetical protein
MSAENENAKSPPPPPPPPPPLPQASDAAATKPGRSGLVARRREGLLSLGNVLGGAQRDQVTRQTFGERAREEARLEKEKQLAEEKCKEARERMRLAASRMPTDGAFYASDGGATILYASDESIVTLTVLALAILATLVTALHAWAPL